jgi:hypothetical protein
MKFLTLFRDRDLLLAQIFWKIFLTVLDVLRCPESKTRKIFFTLLRDRDLEFLTQIFGKHFFFVFSTFDDVLSQKLEKFFLPFLGIGT